MLFIDARDIFTQVDRAHRDWTPKQIELLANIVRVYRGEKPERQHDGKGFEKKFQGGKYQDVPGLCKVATLEEIEEQGWSLNPGRYVGVGEQVEKEHDDFRGTLGRLASEFVELTAEAHHLEELIGTNVSEILRS